MKAADRIDNQLRGITLTREDADRLIRLIESRVRGGAQ